MKYTKSIETVGDASIVEHIVEGDFEEVLALFKELEAKDAVEYHGVNNHINIDFEDPNVTKFVQETFK